MSSVRLTSVWTYQRIKDNGMVGNMQDKVYQDILENPNSCDRDIAERNDLRICSVTPRRGELERMGLVVEVGKEERSYFEDGKQVNSTVNVYAAVDFVDDDVIQKFLLSKSYVKKRKESLKSRERVEGLTVIREITHKERLEASAKLVEYFLLFPPSKCNTKLIYDRFEGGVHKIKIMRDLK